MSHPSSAPALRSLALDSATHAVWEHALMGVQATQTYRAGVLDALLSWKKEQPAEVIVQLDTFIARFGRISPFAWVQLDVVLLMYTAAAHLQANAPGSTPVADSADLVNEFLADNPEHWRDSTVLQPLIMASDGFLKQFIATVVEWQRLFANFGTIKQGPSDLMGASLIFEEFPTAAGRLFLPGMFCAWARLFDPQAQVQFTVIDSQTAQLDIRWF